VEYPRVPELPRGWLFGFYGLVYFLFCYRLVKRLVREEKIDLIHAHAIMPDGFAAVLLGRRFDLPVVCTVHGSDVNIYPFRNRLTFWATEWALRRIQHLVTVSFRLKERIVLLIGNRQTHVVHNGAHPQLFRPIPKGQARAKLDVLMDRRVTLFVGNLIPAKGIEFLLDAFSRLRRSQDLLYVVGEGDHKGSLFSLAKRLGIEDSVRLVGRRPHSDVPLWLSAADCLVLPSLSEGFPTILPEAMACRVPVVATEVGGTPEIVRHGETGLLVPPHDPDALAEAIQAVFRGGERVSAMVERAETMARGEFTWERNAQKMLAIYRQARLRNQEQRQ
jgi:glycosyltransferase involved in cell wall biosynthesis